MNPDGEAHNSCLCDSGITKAFAPHTELPQPPNESSPEFWQGRALSDACKLIGELQKEVASLKEANGQLCARLNAVKDAEAVLDKVGETNLTEGSTADELRDLVYLYCTIGMDLTDALYRAERMLLGETH